MEHDSPETAMIVFYVF